MIIKLTSTNAYRFSRARLRALYASSFNTYSNHVGATVMGSYSTDEETEAL